MTSTFDVYYSLPLFWGGDLLRISKNTSYIFSKLLCEHAKASRRFRNLHNNCEQNGRSGLYLLQTTLRSSSSLDIKIKDFLLGNNLNLEAHTLGSLQNGRQRAQGAQPFTLTFTLDPRLQFFSSLQLCDCVSIYTM